jgi:hypothetical protein
MRPRTTVLLVLFILAASGAWWRYFGPGALPRFNEPSFTIVHGSSATLHRLSGGETIATALSAIPDADGHKSPETLVLIRRGPDGMTRQLVDCDACYRLADPQKDQNLRNGDQLIVAAPQPSGLDRPTAPGIPVEK